jgi:hypothetical protein
MLEQSVGIRLQQHLTLRWRVLAEEPDLDERTLADTLEGLTDLNETIAAIVRAALEDEALVTGLKAHMTIMSERATRLQQRAAKRRDIARDAMVEADLKKIMAPDFTLSLRPGSPSLVVTSEDEIPADFWEPQPPKLNRQALLSEIKRGTTVSGATLSNPQAVLSVRTK